MPNRIDQKLLIPHVAETASVHHSRLQYLRQDRQEVNQMLNRTLTGVMLLSSPLIAVAGSWTADVSKVEEKIVVGWMADMF